MVMGTDNPATAQRRRLAEALLTAVEDAIDEGLHPDDVQDVIINTLGPFPDWAT